METILQTTENECYRKRHFCTKLDEKVVVRARDLPKIVSIKRDHKQ